VAVADVKLQVFMRLAGPVDMLFSPKQRPRIQLIGSRLLAMDQGLVKVVQGEHPRVVQARPVLPAETGFVSQIITQIRIVVAVAVQRFYDGIMLRVQFLPLQVVVAARPK
jgi:hypothetical protein